MTRPESCRETPEKRASLAPVSTIPPSDDIQSARARKLKLAPKNARDRLRRAWNGNSRASAVQAFCLECVGWTYNDAVTCAAADCPLYEFRPGRRSRKGADHVTTKKA